ncbi:protein of unknown function [Agreia sp. COWG]|nr:protein of unknown function [Agreia sp. COWG]
MNSLFASGMSAEAIKIHVISVFFDDKSSLEKLRETTSCGVFVGYYEEPNGQRLSAPAPQGLELQFHPNGYLAIPTEPQFLVIFESSR